MARLKTVRPRLEQPGQRLAPAIRHNMDWRAWYCTAEWQAARMATFRRDGFQCQREGCGRIEGDTSRLVCDHIERHNGDRALFFDPANLQTLCKHCHDSDKQRQEAAERRRGAP